MAKTETKAATSKAKIKEELSEEEFSNHVKAKAKKQIDALLEARKVESVKEETEEAEDTKRLENDPGGDDTEA